MRRRPGLLLTLAALLAVPAPACRDREAENVERISRLVQARDFAAMTLLLDSGDHDLRCLAVKTLSWARHPDATPAHFRLIAFDGCGWVYRVDAAWRLMEMRVEGARKAVAAQLETADPRVRWNMAKLFGELKDASERPAIEKCTTDPNVFVAAWCAWTLCRFDRPEDQCKQPNMDLTSGEPSP